MTLLYLHQYTMTARSLLVRAQSRADKATHAEVSSFHLLAELLAIEATVFSQAGMEPHLLEMQIELQFVSARRSSDGATLDLAMVDLLAAAERNAQEASSPVTVEHLARALFAVQDIQALLKGFDVAPESFHEAAPSAAPLSGGGPMSEVVHLHEGRKQLRGLAAAVRAALGMASADDMPERAIRLLDTLGVELGSATGLPELNVIRDSPVRLRLTRSGSTGEISIAWDSTVRMVVMHAKEETSAPTRLSRYTWDGKVGQWATADLKTQFFDALVATLIANLYPEGAPSAEPEK